MMVILSMENGFKPFKPKKSIGRVNNFAKFCYMDEPISEFIDNKVDIDDIIDQFCEDAEDFYKREFLEIPYNIIDISAIGMPEKTMIVVNLLSLFPKVVWYNYGDIPGEKLVEWLYEFTYELRETYQYTKAQERAKILARWERLDPETVERCR